LERDALYSSMTGDGTMLGGVREAQARVAAARAGAKERAEKKEARR